MINTYGGRGSVKSLTLIEVLKNEFGESDMIPIKEQAFNSFDDWITNATRRLTAHPEYFDAQHKAEKGFVDYHFTALCFDQNGMRCRNGGDFKKAKFPVWFVWPDQIAELIMKGQ